MNMPSTMRRFLVLAVLAAPLVGCGGGAEPEKPPVAGGPAPTVEDNKDKINQVEAGKGAMGPAGVSK